jgi:mono/diheme cytochrome c family protein
VRGLFILLTVVLGITTYAQELPPGTGRDEVVSRCLTCHESDLIAQQRLTGPAWGREVDKMIRWGAEVPPSERDAVIAYLAAHFSPARTTTPHPATAQGDGTYRRACLVCHDADLVETQRLGRAAWTREVDKMIRWGAVVSDSEKTPLVDYLAGRFGGM